MNIKYRFKTAAGRGAVLIVFFLEMVCHAQTVPPLINFQGRLTDQTGAPLSGGQYAIQFRLWDSPTASGANDLIWDQQQTITVQTNGVFNVILGSSGGITIPGTIPAVNSLAYAFAVSNCFLGVTVTVSNGLTLPSPTEILPRQQLLSVPFAIQAQEAQQAVVADSLVTNLADALCPAGTIIAYGGGTNDPPGWLTCDGSALNRTNYANLFNAIGTAWGGGDGATTFNLPDLRGMFLRGVNAARSDAFADPDDNTSYRVPIFTGGNSGNAVGSYQQDMFKSHTHTTTWQYMANTGGGYSAQGGGGAFAWGIDLENAVNAAGGDETRPKNAYVYYLIKY